MVANKVWIALATLLALTAVPACATNNDPTTTSSASATSGGAGDTVGVGGSGGSSQTTGGQGGTGGTATVCGDGVVATSEACDDGNTKDGDGCDATCTFEKGWECAGSPTHCTPKCGDGFVVGDEACDDGNSTNSDGCSNKCTLDNGYACTGAPSQCATVCGDGVIAGSEECDDDNAKALDGCSDKCMVENGWACVKQPSLCATTCGDGIIAGAEQCDDHNFLPDDGCDETCQIEQFYTCTGAPSTCATPCGDGHVVGTEQCDDGNLKDADGCSAACKPESGYVCAGTPSACHTVCGDGIVAGAEICDDDNVTNGDGCNVVCKVEPGFTCMGVAPTTCKTTCGDGYAAGAETCDDGNLKNGDGCSDTCLAEHGYVCNNFPSICQTVCGDGIVGGLEQCDDGNNVGGDGCSATCTILTGYKCMSEPSSCATTCGDGIQAGAEQCDDGNLVNGDCCTSACGAEPGCEIEANNSVATADSFTTLAIGNVVKGTIKPIGDRDVFSITIPAGATANITAATLDAFNSSCVSQTEDSFITIYDASGVSLTTDDNSGPGNCAQAMLVGATGGDYYVEVKAALGQIFSYGLTIQVQLVVCGDGTKSQGEQCDDGNLNNGDGCDSTCHYEVAAEIEPNNTPAQALANGAFPVNQLWAGAISTIGDNDYYLVHLNHTADLTIQTFDGNGPGSCVSVDTVVYLYAANGTTQLATNDDGGISPCSLIDSSNALFSGARHLAAGDYYVRVQRFNNSAVINAYDLLITYNALCGNGVIEGAEQCDGGSGCTAGCDLVSVCGDGLLEVGEQCDDANPNNNDGCSSTCQFEPGYSCTASLPSVCTPIIACAAPGQLLSFSATGLPQPVLDFTNTSSPINVTSTGTVTQATLQLNIAHTWDSDMSITLASPTTSTGIDISSNNGGSGDNYANTTFSDNCVTSIASGSAPFAGCYHPEAPLSVFVGQPLQGNWTLNVFDGAGGDQGTLLGWTLTVCVQ